MDLSLRIVALPSVYLYADLYTMFMLIIRVPLQVGKSTFIHRQFVGVNTSSVVQYPFPVCTNLGANHYSFLSIGLDLDKNLERVDSCVAILWNGGNKFCLGHISLTDNSYHLLKRCLDRIEVYPLPLPYLLQVLLSFNRSSCTSSGVIEDGSVLDTGCWYYGDAVDHYLVNVLGLGPRLALICCLSLDCQGYTASVGRFCNQIPWKNGYTRFLPFDILQISVLIPSVYPSVRACRRTRDSTSTDARSSEGLVDLPCSWVRDTKDIRIASNPFLRPYPHTILYHITDFDLAVNIKIIVVNLDSSSDNNNSDSYSTSQISTSEEIDYDSPEPPKSLLKWYHYLSDEYKDNGRFWGSKSGCNESDVKPSWKDIEKAKACMLAKAQASEASSKAKVEACGSKVKVEACGIPLINGGGTFAKVKLEIIEISSDSSEDRKGASKATAPIFYGPSTQGLLDAYGYNTIEEYLSWNYFPSTDNESTDMETTNKRNTDKDCIVDSNSAMSKGKYVPVCKKHKPNMYSHVPVTGSVLGLPNVTTWDEIEKKMGARKSKTCADKAKGKRKVSCGS
ncbi:hypothetical protein Tco_1055609 [Tanacetum coccineum]|uniref:Uncharacterized protein n=1 Tax=Tanacetum coccineum TaxID=301880 RepID=A0ABQ5H1Z2_9ASTR